MKLNAYTTVFLSSFLALFSFQSGNACGFFDDESDYRAMMFRAMTPDMKCMYPFNYTMALYNQPYYETLDSDPGKNDRYRNCKEWQAVCDKSVTIDDIYKIQYAVDGNWFVKVYQTNTWMENFPQNTFIQFLIKKGNKDLLDYMLFAKKMELTEIGGSSRFEEWDSRYSQGDYYNYPENSIYFYFDNQSDSISVVKRELLKAAWNKLNTVSSKFLQQRYAFQVCRLQSQVGQMPEMASLDEIYDKYFGDVKPDNLLSSWAGLFRAIHTPKYHADRYRYFVRVFTNSDEKKMRCVQLFGNKEYDPDSLTHSEQSTAIVMTAIRNPGRVLNKIREAWRLDKSNKYISFLVLREINKLEDWLITPLFFEKYSITNSDPFQCTLEWETDKKLQAENLTTDMQYLAQLKSLIIQLSAEAQGEVKDFYTIGLAHISLLQENVSDARNYLSKVSDKANPSIQLQKKMEMIWLAIKTQNIESDTFKKLFVENIADLEKISTPGYENNQMLYTLTLSLANEYFKKGNRVYGNLMRLKSDMYLHAKADFGNSNVYDWYSDYYRPNGDVYASLEYFDKNATIPDMDKLITLLEKKDKTAFEKYLCAQPLCTVNAYKDLKGTIAFRNNDLPLAYQTFASMPQDYWQTEKFYFSSYLNEDPFVPKGLKREKFRKFDYRFNKADFIKQLIDLQNKTTDSKKHSADNFLRLGDAYFNVSYWGNAWMMRRYGSSVNDEYYTKTECLPQWMQDYMTANTARKYYEEALQTADNDEQRAYASVMLHFIHRNCWDLKQEASDSILAFQYGNRFMQYNRTETFKMYECPLIKHFLNRK